MLILSLHVQPVAARTLVMGVHGDALKIKLAAPPVDGKANGGLQGRLVGFVGLVGEALASLG